MINYISGNKRFILFLFALIHLQIHVFSQQTARSLTAANGESIGFYEYKPVDYNSDPSKKYPLIIFLHGIGERGNGTTELSRVLGVGIPHYINWGNPMRFYWNGKWETFLVLSPQLNSSYGWWPEFYADEMIKYAKQNLRADTNRIILTGLSLGGGGTWAFASASQANSRKLAAIAPICGTCSMTNGCNIASSNLPVWAFHASDDGTVSVGCTTGSVASINYCNPSIKPVQTIWPDGNHGIWDRAYDTTYNWQNPNIFEWFLGQNKSLPANIFPNANAGQDQTTTTTTGSVTLNGSSSNDPDGNIVRYIWKKVGGPGYGSITNANSTSTTVTGLTTSGTYQFELTVVDNRASYSKATVKVLVSNGAPPPANQLPVANAGTDITITLPTNSSILNGNGSSDSDGFINSYGWTKINGPEQFTIVNPSSSSTSLTNLVKGVYTFRLVVTDNAGSSDDDTVIITVNAAPPPNIPPNANAGADINLTWPENSTTLSGTNSTDPDGTVNFYSWSKVNGPAQFSISNAAISSPVLTNLVQGRYHFRLQVTDNSGGTDDDTIIVSVNAPPPPVNKPPVANAGSDIMLTLPLNKTILNGSASIDEDGTISSYAWTKLKGPGQCNFSNPNAVSPTISDLVEGVYTFRLSVTDNSGITDDDSVIVTVKAALPPPPAVNLRPKANCGPDIVLSFPLNSTTLDATSSVDIDGFINSYLWSKISGPPQFSIRSPNDSISSLENLVPGTYFIRLMVTDNAGATDSDTLMITVNAGTPPANNQPPVSLAGEDITLTLPDNNATINGTTSYDPDGHLNGYQWTRISGPAQFTIGDANGGITSLSHLTEGTYTFRLTVWDNSWTPGYDTIKIIVKPAPPPTPNYSPVANAGPDVYVSLPENSISLNGGASIDSDGSISSYLWTKIGGPAELNFSNPASVSTTLNNLVEGTYIIRLQVTDNSGATGADTVSVSVNGVINKPPSANAGNDIIVSLPDPVIELNATASYDPDGIISSYTWSRKSGPGAVTILNSTTSKPKVVGVESGVYTFQVVVSDNKGATMADEVNVTVVPEQNRKPIANAGNDTTITIPGGSIILDGSASVDSDGKLTSYRWKMIKGPSTAGIVHSDHAITVVKNLLSGDYVFELTVSDNKGQEAKDSVTISVVNNLRYEEKLVLFPNPAREVIRIRCLSDSMGLTKINVLDVNGTTLKTLFKEKGQSFLEESINISNLKEGIYYISILIKGNKSMMSKFIKY